MRRWICIFVLLAGFTSQDYGWLRHSRNPVATELPIDRLPWRGQEVQPWNWWLLS